MGEQWVKYVYNFDIVLEEALKICIKNSLKTIFEALHGDGTTGPNPLLKLYVHLINNRVSNSKY